MNCSNAPSFPFPSDIVGVIAAFLVNDSIPENIQQLDLMLVSSTWYAGVIGQDGMKPKPKVLWPLIALRDRGVTSIRLLRAGGDKDVQALVGSPLLWPQLTSVNLKLCRLVTDKAIELMSNTTVNQLTSLNLLCCTALTDACTANFGNFPQLRTLNIRACKCISDEGLKNIGSLLSSSITELNVGVLDKLSDVGMAHLAQLHALRILDISCCKHVTGAGLTHLATLPQLTSLSVAHTFVSDAGLDIISSMESLTSVQLCGCDNITGTGLSRFAERVCRRYLSLDLWGCSNVTDSALDDISRHMANLSYLCITGCDVTNVGLRSVAQNLHCLLTLIMSGLSKITNDGIVALVTSANIQRRLQVLDIADNPMAVGDLTMFHIAKMEVLTRLNVCGSEAITDRGIENLVGTSKGETFNNDEEKTENCNTIVPLTYLDVSCCGQLTDASLAHLTKLPTLTQVNLDYCDKITDGGRGKMLSFLELV